MKPEKLFKWFLLFAKLSGALAVFILLCGCGKKNEYFLDSGIRLPLAESLVIKIRIASKFMDRDMPCNIYFPAGYGGGSSYPVLYALHGHSSTEDMWIDAGLPESADGLIEEKRIGPLIMVFPHTKDADAKEIKADWADDGKFDERNVDKFISRELVHYIDTHFDTMKSAEERYIGGLSEGGAIALRTAFHHPDLFSRVGGYTPAVTSSDYSGTQLEKWLFPNDDPGKIKDAARFASKHHFTKLTVYLDAGNLNDPFMQGVQSLNTALEKRGIQSEFHLYEGGHSLEHNHGDYSAYLEFFAGIE